MKKIMVICMTIAILMVGVFVFPATAQAAESVSTWGDFVLAFESIRNTGGTIELTDNISTNGTVTLSATAGVTVNTNDYGIRVSTGDTLSLGGDIDIIRVSDGAPISVYNGANLILGGNVSVTGTNYGLIIEGGGAATLTGEASVQSSSTGTGVAVRQSGNGSGSLNIGENSEIDGGNVGVFCVGDLLMSGGRVDVSETDADAIQVSGGDATITSGVINATGDGGCGVNVLAGGSVDYRSGTIRAMGPSGLGVVVDGGSTLTTYGGLIEGTKNGVAIGSTAGDVVLYNGTIQSSQPGNYIFLEDDTSIWVYSITGLRESDIHWDIQGAPANYAERDSFGITAPPLPRIIELTLGEDRTVDFTVQGQQLNGDLVSLQDQLGASGTISNATYTVSGNSITFTPTRAGNETLSFTDDITYNGIWTSSVSVSDPSVTPPANPSSQGNSGDHPQSVTESTTGVTVSGDGIRGGTELIVQPLSLHEPGQCAACDAIRQYMGDNDFNVLFDADLSLSRSYSGGLTITIPVGEQYNGQILTLLHCHEGTLETLTATVVDGQAVFTVSGLSPVALVADRLAITEAAADTALDDIPITGDNGSTLIWWLLCGLSAAGIGMLIILGIRKKSYMS